MWERLRSPRALASALDTELIRLQCYEGFGHPTMPYTSGNHSRQILEIRLMEAGGGVDRQEATEDLFSERFSYQNARCCRPSMKAGKSPRCC